MLLVVAVTAMAAAAAGQDRKHGALRTENGHPDLQGVWNFSSGVPLQRPVAFADKKFFTKEEFDKERAAIQRGLTALARLLPIESAGLGWFDNTPQIQDLRTSLITYPVNGRLPALVEGLRPVHGLEDLIAVLGASDSPPAGLVAISDGDRKESYADFGAAELCLFGADVPFVPKLDGNYVQILQARDYVVLLTDFDSRIVALDGRPPLPGSLRHWSGTSRGRWDGETLVVETSNFNDRTPSFAGVGNAREKVVTERFTRRSSTVIEYAATVNDPKTFQDRIELSFPMALVETRIYEGACHEGNYSLRHSLSGAPSKTF
jgi:hypothetical protein